MKIFRKWVNQPSNLQPHHELHGMEVLYDPDEKRIYFTSGNIISQQIDPSVLSDGWPSCIPQTVKSGNEFLHGWSRMSS